MKRIRIEEAALRRLEDDAQRAVELSEALAEEQKRTTSLEAEVAQLRRIDQARTLVEAATRSAGVTFNRLQVRGLLADITVTESGELDRDALQAMVDDEIWSMRLGDAITPRPVRGEQRGA